MQPINAVQIVKEINEVAERISTGSEAASDFSMGIVERAASMREWIEKNDICTNRQAFALENMLKGLKKWERD